MEKKVLNDLINSGLTHKEIANKVGCSQTNVRYYIKKYNIKKGYCIVCNNQLQGNQRKYCSDQCKGRIYKENANIYENQKKRAIERKIKLINMCGGECSVCGYKKNIAALHFHHILPDTKLFQLDSRKCANSKWSTLLTEVKKCSLLCANCHAELHHKKYNNLI